MADTPNPMNLPTPDEKDINLLEMNLNIQKEIRDVLEKQSETIAKIGGINKNNQAAMNAALGNMHLHLGSIEKHYESYVDVLKYIDSISDAQRETEKAQIKSAKESHIDKINNSKKLFNVQAQVNAILIEQYEKIKKQHDFIFDSVMSRLSILPNEVAEYKNISKQLSEIFPKLKGSSLVLYTSFLVISKFARDMYNSFEKSAFAFRKMAGMMREQAGPLRSMAEGIAIQFAHVGVTIDGAYESIKALGSEMGGLHNVTKGLVTTTSLLSSQLGVSELNTAEMLRNMAAVSKTTMQSQKSMAYFAANISMAAGIPLNVVMADVAKMSGTAYSMMSKIPLVIIKSAVEARRLNTNINDIAAASEKILDFQNSVNAEMEASVLIGESINLQRARQLAYNKDIVGSTKEILNIAKSIDFQNLDVFQMQAFARATGRNVDELMKMLQAEKELENARNSTNPAIQKQLKAYESMRAANEAMAKESGNNLELILMQKANQEKMVALQNKWNQLLMKASVIFLPLIDLAMDLTGVILDLAPYMMPWVKLIPRIAGELQLLWAEFELGGKFLRSIYDIGMKAFSWVPKVVELFKDMGTLILISTKHLGKYGAIIRNIFQLGSKFGTFLGSLGGLLGPIGWILTATQVIYKTFTKWKDIFNDPSMNIGEKILRGLWAVVTSIFEVLIEPFRLAWNWVSNLWGGHSPSRVGLSIVKGIQSCEGDMYDALTTPFNEGYDDISKKLSKGIGANMNIEQGASSAYIPLAQFNTVQPSETVPKQSVKPTQEIDRSSTTKESNKALADILVAINNLNKNLESGKIGVYIDGQLMSATLARQTNFRGGFGMNVVA